MIAYNAKVKADTVRLSRDLLNLPKATRPALVARIMAEGLMLPTQWRVKIPIWMLQKRHRTDLYGAWTQLLARAPQIADDSLEQTAVWAVSGKDASGEGVGGFNQVEMDKLALMIKVLQGVAA